MGQECSTACDSIVLGSVIRGAAAVYLWPFPEPPYSRLSFDLVQHKLKFIHIMTICHGYEWKNSTSHEPLMKVERTRLRVHVKGFEEAFQIALGEFKAVRMCP
jgi:hypothetical protein